MMRVILLKNGKDASATLLNALRHGGVSFEIGDAQNLMAVSKETASLGLKDCLAMPLVVVHEIAESSEPQAMKEMVAAVSRVYPEAALVACRRAGEMEKGSSGEAATFAGRALNLLGFHAVVNDAAQLLELLREIETRKLARNGASFGITENGLLPGSQLSHLDAILSAKRAGLSLAKNLKPAHLRPSFELITALHFASDQRSAARVALDSLSALVRADHWAFYLNRETAQEVLLESLAAHGSQTESLAEDDWRRALGDGDALASLTPSKAARRAVKLGETVRASEAGRRILAIPLLAFAETERMRGEKVIGVLEAVREDSSPSRQERENGSASHREFNGAALADTAAKSNATRSRAIKRVARAFSKAEIGLLNALAAPVAAALANAARITEAERLSLTDDLTKLHNARFLRQFLVNEIKRARRYGSSVAALFLDLDDFKQINDQHGHLVGSHVLKEMAQVILAGVRDTDIVARYGGDEFVVILPETNVELARRVAERVRERIARTKFHGGRGLRLHLTASFGVAAFPEHVQSPQQLLDRADTAMYEAKAARKNCVRAAEMPDLSKS